MAGTWMFWRIRISILMASGPRSSPRDWGPQGSPQRASESGEAAATETQSRHPRSLGLVPERPSETSALWPPGRAPGRAPGRPPGKPAIRKTAWSKALELELEVLQVLQLVWSPGPLFPMITSHLATHLPDKELETPLWQPFPIHLSKKAWRSVFFRCCRG